MDNFSHKFRGFMACLPFICELQRGTLPWATTLITQMHCHVQGAKDLGTAILSFPLYKGCIGTNTRDVRPGARQGDHRDRASGSDHHHISPLPCWARYRRRCFIVAISCCPVLVISLLGSTRKSVPFLADTKSYLKADLPPLQQFVGF